MEQYLSRLRLTVLCLTFVSLVFMMSLSGWRYWFVPLIALGLLVAVTASATLRKSRAPAPALTSLPEERPLQAEPIRLTGAVELHRELWRQRERILAKSLELLGDLHRTPAAQPKLSVPTSSLAG